MGGELREQRKPETWGWFITFFYLFLGFIIPIVGIGIGIHGLTHYGKRGDGFFILCAGLAGFVYMPRIWLLALMIAGAMH